MSVDTSGGLVLSGGEPNASTRTARFTGRTDSTETPPLQPSRRAAALQQRSMWRSMPARRGRQLMDMARLDGISLGSSAEQDKRMLGDRANQDSSLFVVYRDRRLLMDTASHDRRLEMGTSSRDRRLACDERACLTKLCQPRRLCCSASSWRTLALFMRLVYSVSDRYGV
jgi:hypothetical protein